MFEVERSTNKVVVVPRQKYLSVLQFLLVRPSNIINLLYFTKILCNLIYTLLIEEMPPKGLLILVLALSAFEGCLNAPGFLNAPGRLMPMGDEVD